MRVVGGRFRGQQLVTPAGDATRPTSDRVREAVFNILLHGIDGFTLDEIRVLDLFAGSGALGLEALSRGAAFCLFIDDAVEARGAIRENIEKLRLTGESKLFRRDATRLGEAAQMGQFGLVFLDPPYGRGLAEPALIALAGGGWLAPGAVVVVEEAGTVDLQVPAGFTRLDRRDYGDTAVHFLRA